MNEEVEMEILNCQYALDGKSMVRSCSKVDDRKCRYYGNRCWFDEKFMGKRRESRVVFDDDDGYPD